MDKDIDERISDALDGLQNRITSKDTQIDRLTKERDDYAGALRIAAEAADRFRDVLTQAFGWSENPGDDDLIEALLSDYGKWHEPERTAWRDFCETSKRELMSGEGS